MKLFPLFFCCSIAFCSTLIRGWMPCEERDDHNAENPGSQVAECKDLNFRQRSYPPQGPIPNYEGFIISDPETADVWRALEHGHKVLEGRAIIDNFKGSGDVKLDYVLGCLELDLNGHNEFEFMEDTTFLKDLFERYDCENKIRNTGAEICLHEHQMVFLQKNGFEIDDKIKTCDKWHSFGMSAGTLRHDLFIVNEVLSESEMEPFKMIRSIEGRIVCQNSVLENFKFLENVVHVVHRHFEEHRRQPTIEFESCSVLEQTPFLPRLVRLKTARGVFGQKEIVETALSMKHNFFSFDNETIERLMTVVKKKDPKKKDPKKKNEDNEEFVAPFLIENNYNISRTVEPDLLSAGYHLMLFIVPLLLSFVIFTIHITMKKRVPFYLHDKGYIREFLRFSALKELKIELYDEVRKKMKPVEDEMHGWVHLRLIRKRAAKAGGDEKKTGTETDKKGNAESGKKTGGSAEAKKA